MANRNQNMEHEPLLARAKSADNLSSTTAEPTAGTKWLFFTTITPKYRWIPLLGCAIIFINEAEYFVKQVATMRAIEAMYCYEFWLKRNSPLADLGKHIPERLCKDDSIQKDLAKTAGLIMFVRMLSAMIGAIPLGWVADRYGRKTVIVLHKVNVCINCATWVVLYTAFPKVPIWTLYLSGLPGLIGGNYDIGLAMLFASYTDVMPSATERASLFFLTTSMQYFAQTFCPPIGAWLMNLDGNSGTPQVNLMVSLYLAIFTALISIFLFPETVHESREKRPVSGTASQIEEQNGSDQIPNLKKSSRLERLMQGFKDTVNGVGVINILLLSLSICFAATGIKAIDWYAIVQYPVIKLDWTFPQASSVVSMQGFLMLIYFSIMLPAINRILATWLGIKAGQFVIMACSALLLTVGALIIGLSNTTTLFITGVVIYLFGEGLPTATQAYIVSLVDKSKVARVMATLSIASIFGKLTASILFPKMLALGLDTHVDILVGLPLFVSAVMFVVSAACIGVVGLRMRRADRDQVVVER
ncbi:MFS general substrate transporter [Microthyrium microscopicum]|uniref:MFS general substrate transporter n=1 Tax=Microthyrium microscopicum TaxID=703497 RepID=A0A6A6UUJ5_9PEZI|nr:MFS general substrate transporter [Microthyrium microscopicum]